MKKAATKKLTERELKEIEFRFRDYSQLRPVFDEICRLKKEMKEKDLVWQEEWDRREESLHEKYEVKLDNARWGGY